MTTVDVVYRYEVEPAAGAVTAIARLREVYGVRQVGFQEKDKTVRVEYDSTRLSEPVIHNLLRRAGLDIVQRVVLAAAPPPAAAPASAS